MPTRPSYLLFLVLCLTVPIHGAKQNQMSAAGRFEFESSLKNSFDFTLEINQCLDKSKDLNTGCEFIQCFHKRYHCSDESITAWAYNLCLQFPQEVVLEFTPDVRLKH